MTSEEILKDTWDFTKIQKYKIMDCSERTTDIARGLVVRTSLTTDLILAPPTSNENFLEPPMVFTDVNFVFYFLTKFCGGII